MIQKAGDAMSIKVRILKKIEFLENEIAMIRRSLENEKTGAPVTGILRGKYRELGDIPYSEFQDAKKIWKIRNVE